MAIKILHLVRRGADCYPLRIAERGGEGHAILLLGDGVYQASRTGGHTFAMRLCASERGQSGAGTTLLEDAEAIDLICEAERIVSW